MVLVSEPEDVAAHGEKLTQQILASYDEAVAKGNRAAPPAELVVPWDEARQMARRSDSSRDAGARRGDATSRVSPRSSSPAACPNGSAEIRSGRQAGDTIVFVANSPGLAERTIELLADYEIFAAPDRERRGRRGQHPCSSVSGHLSRGFRLPEAGLQFWAETDVFEEDRKTHERRRSATRTFLSDFRDLKIGDLVVHVDHGIGVFVGLKRIDVGAAPQEFMELRYAGEDKLFVPVERLDLVQKYTGASRPSLDKLGGTTWEKAKTRVKKAMRDMAEELLKLYAARKAVPGHAFSPDSHWQQEFEDAFEWELTADQKTAVADIKGDMESPTPMDRLLCGDVGYGKTEVAMRAAFKAVMDGKQVAVPRADDSPRVPAPEDAEGSVRRVPGPHRHGQPLPDQGGTEGHTRGSRRPARSRSSSAPTACSRRTSSSAISVCWSWTKSSASASRTRNASSRCASASTC